MKIKYVKFKNFIGFYNGMGMKEIELEINNNDSKFILIAGANGSGKSTLLENLHPYANLNNNKIIRNGKKGLKEIHYIDYDVLYIIKHFYDPNGDSHSVKSYITKVFRGTEEELNPNGNVTSFIECIETEFKIDKSYIELVQLGNDMRGLIDMTSAKRKQYVTKFTNMSNIYLSYYKKINDECRVIKNMIKNLSDKLEKNDKQDLKDELNYIESNILKYNNNRDSLIKEISEKEAKIKLLDPNGTIVEDYKNIVNRFKEITTFLNKNKLDINEDVEMMKNNLNKLETNIIIYTSKISNLNQNTKELVDKKTDYENNIFELESEKRKINYEKDNLDNMNKTVKVLNNMIDEYECKSKKIHIPEISKNELINLYSTFEEIKNINDIIHDQFSNEIIKIYFNTEMDIKSEYIVYMNKIKSLEINLSNIEKYIIENSNKIESIKNLLNKRPSNCKIDTCPFIKDALEQLDDLNEHTNQLNLKERLSTDLNKLKKNNIYEDLLTIDSYVNKIRTLVLNNKNIINRIDEFRFMTSDKELNKELQNHGSFINVNIIQKYISLIEERDIYETNKIKIKMVEKDFIILNNNKTLFDKINIDLEKNKKNLLFTNELISGNNTKLKELEDAKCDLEYKYRYLKEHIDIQLKYKDYTTEYNILKNSIVDKKIAYEELNNYTEFMNKNKSKLNFINSSLNDFINRRDKLKYKYKQYKQFTKEKKIYQKHFKKLDILKNALSDKNGIPVVFVQLYLQQTKVYANRLLKKAFDGNLLLDNFQINDKYFRIPCYGKGERNIDVSTASSGERSLIALAISLAMVKQQKIDYGIIELDELDGPLDNKHRKLFVNLLEESCDDMNIEQVFIISHNDTFSNYDMSYILFKGNNIECKNEDIIFNYE